MTAADLALYLDVMRDRSVSSAHLKFTRALPDGSREPVEIAVTYEPSIARDPLPGDAPTPGGWKGAPPGLDAPMTFEEAP